MRYANKLARFLTFMYTILLRMDNIWAVLRIDQTTFYKVMESSCMRFKTLITNIDFMKHLNRFLKRHFLKTFLHNLKLFSMFTKPRTKRAISNPWKNNTIVCCRKKDSNLSYALKFHHEPILLEISMWISSRTSVLLNNSRKHVGFTWVINIEKSDS